MHTIDLQRSIKSLFADLAAIRPFTDALSLLAKSAEAIEEQLPGIAQGGPALNQYASQIHALFAQTRHTTSAINNRQFFKAFEHFQRIIAQLQQSQASTTKLVSSLNAEIEEFTSVYDAFLSSQSGESAVPLILTAKTLHAKIETLFDTLQLVEETISNYDVPGNAEAQLTLLLPSYLDVAEFARRLQAIHDLYSELCMLLSVSQSDHPLRISKIESGSLWAKLFGESKVIGLMVSFLEQTASWIFRSYTSEGKISSVPRKVESIDSLLRLTERLDAAGINTSEMKAHIEKSAVIISKSLSDILDGQSSVTVNDETISVSSELNKGLLAAPTFPQLQSSEPSKRDEPPDFQELNN